MNEYQEIIALKKINAILILEMRSIEIGTIRVNPIPVICKVVLSFPRKSDFKSLICLEREIMKILK